MFGLLSLLGILYFSLYVNKLFKLVVPEIKGVKVADTYIIL